MDKTKFFELIGYARLLNEHAKSKNESEYLYVTKKYLRNDCYDVLTFWAMLNKDDFPASFAMTNDTLYDAFLIWKDGTSRGQYQTAMYIKDFIYAIELPEKLQAQCINAAFMEYGLKRAIPETKVLYGKLVYIAAFKEKSKIVSGFNITKKDLQDLSDSSGLRFEESMNVLQETGFIYLRKLKKRKDTFKVFVKVTDDFIENMGEFDHYYPDDEDEPWVIVGEWETKEVINQKISDFKEHYGFDPLIHILTLPKDVKEKVSEIKG